MKKCGPSFSGDLLLFPCLLSGYRNYAPRKDATKTRAKESPTGVIPPKSNNITDKPRSINSNIASYQAKRRRHICRTCLLGDSSVSRPEGTAFCRSPPTRFPPRCAGPYPLRESRHNASPPPGLSFLPRPGVDGNRQRAWRRRDMIASCTSGLLSSGRWIYPLVLKSRPTVISTANRAEILRLRRRLDFCSPLRLRFSEQLLRKHLLHRAWRGDQMEELINEQLRSAQASGAKHRVSRPAALPAHVFFAHAHFVKQTALACRFAHTFGCAWWKGAICTQCGPEPTHGKLYGVKQKFLRF